MPFRCIMVENPASISIKKTNLCIKTDCEHLLPPEDITALLIESRQASVSAAAMAALGMSGCTVYFCDEKHMPCAVLTPFAQHSRGPEVIRKQLQMGAVQKKHLWQSIVVAKIQNQARCLTLLGKDTDAAGLNEMACMVKSGDSTNREAMAAMRYFSALFGDEFHRRDEDNPINAALNYGYAILRGCTARCLAVYGFLPAAGIHHHNDYNNFSLADDLMEPFRPVVDLLVAGYMTDITELVPSAKRLLFNCLNLDILSGEQHHTVAFAIERMVKSLSSAVDDPERQLCLPTLLETAQHSYE